MVQKYLPLKINFTNAFTKRNSIINKKALFFCHQQVSVYYFIMQIIQIYIHFVNIGEKKRKNVIKTYYLSNENRDDRTTLEKKGCYY